MSGIKPKFSIAGLAGLAIAIFIMTGGFAAARLYFEAGGAPADVIALRYGVSAVLMLPLVLIARARLRRHPGWWKAVALAAVGGAPFGACVFVGVTGAPITHGAGIVPAVAMVLGAVAARLFLGEPLGPKRLLGMAITLIALATLLGPDLGTRGVTWWGDLAFLCAGILWGSFTVLLRALRVGPLDGAALAAVFSLPYLLLYFLLLEPQIFDVPIVDTLWQGFYQGVLFNTVAVGIYAWSVSRVGAAAAVAAMPLMPAYGSLMEWGLFGRIPHSLVAPAIVLMAVGIWLTAFAGASETTPPKGQAN